MGRSKQLKLIYYIGDLIALNLAIAVASYIKFNNGIEYHATQYPILFVVFNISWLAIVFLSKAYDFPRTAKITKRIWKIVGTIFIHALLISAFWVMAKAYYYSREFLVLTYLAFSILILFWRVSFIVLLRIYRKSKPGGRNVVIYGYGEVGQELEQFFSERAEFGYRFKGYFDDDSLKSNVRGNLDSLKSIIQEEHIEEMYCSLPDLQKTTVRELIDFGDDNLIKVKLLYDFREISSKGLELERYEHIPILNVTAAPLDEKKNRFVKRAFDIAFSSFIIIFFLSWFIPLVSILIKIDSRGPVFFKQKRTGKNNKSFWCLKFRTMYINNVADMQQATLNDTRITSVGSILRKTSLDEFPQFINVFLGDMSVVGPRPHMLSHTEKYSKLIEKFMARHFVKPGITGLAQAKGYRGETGSLSLMKNRVRFDRFYIENWSLLLDLKIIVLTIPLLIRGDQQAF